MSPTIKNVKTVHGSWLELESDAMHVRHAVFIQEQGVPAELETDDYDYLSMHVVIYDSQGGPIATGRLLPDGHIGRMAVLAQQRGQGLGALVMQRLLSLAKEQQLHTLRLSAQTHALGFYQGLGFVQQGDEYLEVGIPHVRMIREG